MRWDWRAGRQVSKKDIDEAMRALERQERDGPQLREYDAFAALMAAIDATQEQETYAIYIDGVKC